MRKDLIIKMFFYNKLKNVDKHKEALAIINEWHELITSKSNQISIEEQEKIQKLLKIHHIYINWTQQIKLIVTRMVIIGFVVMFWAELLAIKPKLLKDMILFVYNVLTWLIMDLLKKHMLR